ncbi:MAG: hypothetical protein ABH884_04315 [Candidatus Komeilibacteria bacterium]
MNKYLIFSLIGIAVLALGVTQAFAYSGNDIATRPAGQIPFGERFDSAEWQAMQANHDARQQAIEAGDYQTWYQLQTSIEKPRMSELITADNFVKLQEMHNLMQTGDWSAAQAIGEELGLPHSPMHGMKMGWHRGDKDRNFQLEE